MVVDVAAELGAGSRAIGQPESRTRSVEHSRILHESEANLVWLGMTGEYQDVSLLCKRTGRSFFQYSRRKRIRIEASIVSHSQGQ